MHEEILDITMGLVSLCLEELAISGRTGLSFLNSRGELFVVDGQIEADEQTDVGLSRGGPGSFGVGFFHVLIDQSNREVGVISFSR